MADLRTCETCKCEFPAKKPTSRFCSQICYYKSPQLRINAKGIGDKLRSRPRPDLSGSNARHWKGGVILDPKGYIKERIYGRGYILQHRLVMEKHIGRKLTPNETVHHRNGIRSDNRIENLELWIGHHGSGQRYSEIVMADGSENYMNLAA